MNHAPARKPAVDLAVALALAIALGCSKPDPDALKRPKTANKLQYPVQVAPLEVRQVQYNVMAPGSIDAFQQVQITARVAGAVDRVAFVEGQIVKQGDPLVVIEAERFQVAVDQAKAALAKTVAAHQAAEAELARRQGAVAAHPGLVAGEEIEQYQTAVASTQADSDSSAQLLRTAQLNLRDAFVRAPIAGVIQSRTVQAGQYLQPGAVLATLLQRDPLLVRFPVTESDAPRVKVGMTANVTLRESARTYAANIILVAAAADPTTRLVAVTATDRRQRPQVLASARRVLRRQRADRRRATGHRRPVALGAADREGQPGLYGRREEHRAREERQPGDAHARGRRRDHARA